MHLSEYLLVGALLGTSQVVRAVDLDVNSVDSLTSLAKAITTNLISTYYTSPAIPGNLPSPYYWWETGIMFDSLLTYARLTNDTSHNAAVSQGLQHQMGPLENFMPLNQTKAMANDDVAYWALAAITAQEYGLPKVEGDQQQQQQQQPSWLNIAVNAWNDMAERWDESTCGGGIRWQIFPFNTGYDYKTAPGWYFLLSARLGQITGNQTYFDEAAKAYEWAEKVGLVVEEDGKTSVFDGTSVKTNCSQVNRLQWSNGQAAFVLGSATLWNKTSNDTWKTRTQSHISAFTSVFLSDQTGSKKTLVESACEPKGQCSTDQKAFKSLAARYLSSTVALAPFTSDTILPILKDSAEAAAKSCSDDGESGVVCGFGWVDGKNDGEKGVGEQLNALEVVLGSLSAKGVVGTGATGNGNATETGSGGAAAATGTTTTASGSAPTGAAAGLKVGGLLGVVAVAGAMVLL